MSAPLLVRRLGLRHARSRRLRTVLTVVGVAAAVALVFSVQVMNTTLSAAVTGLPEVFSGGDRLVVSAPSSRGLDTAAVERVRSTDGVSAAAPLLLSRTEMTAGDRRESVLVVGATPDLASLRRAPGSPEVTGDLGGDGRGVLLAADVGRRLRAGTGSPVEVETPRGAVELRATGTVDDPELDRANAGSVALMELSAAQEVFDRSDRVDMVVVEAEGSAAALRERLEDRLGGEALVGTSVDELSGMENVRPFAGLTSAVGAIALAIAGFVVLITMSMAVAERRRELSLARVLGATPRSLRRAVLGEALVMGVVATGIGTVAGWFLARLLVSRAGTSYAPLLNGAALGEARVEPSAVVLAVLAGVVVCLAGALLPARQSLRVAPLVALRPVAPYEWDAPDERRRPGRAVAAGLVLVVAALVVGLGGDRPTQRTGVAAVVLLLAGVLLLLPAVVHAAIRGLRPVSARARSLSARLAVDEMANGARRTSAQVGVLVFSMSLVVGMASTVGSMVDRFDDLAHDYISAPVYVESTSRISYVATQPLDRGLGDEMARLPGVDAVLPGQTSYIVVDGRPSVLYANPLRAAADAGVLDRLGDGRMARDPEAFVEGLLDGGIAVSSRTRDMLGLDVGDRVAVPTPSGRATFRVAAVYDDIAAVPTFILDYDVYAARWRDDGAQRFQVMTAPGREREALEAVREHVREAGLPAAAYSREEAIDRDRRNLNRQFELAQAIQWGALVLAGVTMAVTFFATVVQRRWQHGMQRLLGMTSRQLGRTVLLEAAIAAVLGWLGAVVVGVTLGWLMGRAASGSFGARLPFHLPLTTLALCLAAGFAVTFGGAAYPRWVALRSSIIDVVRNE